MSFPVSRCRSCGAEIIWAITLKGMPMPVDAYPHEDGNLLLETKPDGTITVVVRQEGERRPHFSTCPHADEWRKRGRG